MTLEATQSHGERVKVAILTAGVALMQHSPETVSARRIAGALKMTHANVLYHFGSVKLLKDAIAREAVRVGDKVVVPMLIAAKHPATEMLSAGDRKRYMSGC